MTQSSKFPEFPILLMGKDNQTLERLTKILTENGINNLESCNDNLDLILIIYRKRFSLVLLDVSTEQIEDNLKLTRIIRILTQDKVLIILKKEDIDSAAQFISENLVVGCIERNLKDLEFIKEIYNALKLINIDNECIPRHEGIITAHQDMKDILDQLKKNTSSSVTVLITGECGTGKKHIARETNQYNDQNGNFIEKKPGQKEEEFLEEICHSETGTIFIEGIEKLSRYSQDKLYSILKNKKSDNTNIRYILVSNQDRKKLKSNKEFQEKLYSLLENSEIPIPPLRKHEDDIRWLTLHFIELAAKKMEKPVPLVPEELFNLLSNYQFPMNIQELKDIVFQAMEKYEDGILSLQVFREKISTATANMIKKNSNEVIK